MIPPPLPGIRRVARVTKAFTVGVTEAEKDRRVVTARAKIAVTVTEASFTPTTIALPTLAVTVTEARRGRPTALRTLAVGVTDVLRGSPTRFVSVDVGVTETRKDRAEMTARAKIAVRVTDTAPVRNAVISLVMLAVAVMVGLPVE